MKVYKVSYSFMRDRKSVLVTAESETDAINIAKGLLCDADEIADEILLSTLIRCGYFKAEEIPKPEKKYPYYVTLYSLYPIYEAAEGGYYYNGVGIADSYGFQTFRKARQFLAKRYKECFEEDHLTNGWECIDTHKYFGVYNANGYIGEGYFWQLERKQGISSSGRVPYC